MYYTKAIRSKVRKGSRPEIHSQRGNALNVIKITSEKNRLGNYDHYFSGWNIIKCPGILSRDFVQAAFPEVCCHRSLIINEVGFELRVPAFISAPLGWHKKVLPIPDGLVLTAGADFRVWNSVNAGEPVWPRQCLYYLKRKERSFTFPFNANKTFSDLINSAWRTMKWFVGWLCVHHERWNFPGFVYLVLPF